MSQTILCATFGANFGHVQEWVPLGVGGFWVYPDAFGDSEQARQPWSSAGTFRNLTVHVYGTHGDSTFTVLKNGVATTLSCVVPSAGTDAADTLHSFTIAAGDDVCLQLDGTSEANPGFWATYSCEFVSAVAGESSYGIGSSINGAANNQEFVGGALGNGIWAGSPSLSNTYSIASAAGAITRLDAKNYVGAPGTDAWTYGVIKNSVLQDGSGGTVNTTAVITGADTTAHSTFTLPIAPGDHVELHVKYTGAGASFDHGYGTASVLFAATDTAQFMVCGGTNDVIDSTQPSQVWNGSEQLSQTESKTQVPVGPTSFGTSGLYVELSSDPGASDASWTYAIRNSGADTSTTLSIVGTSATSGSILNFTSFSSGQTIDLGIVPANIVNGTQLHWGLALTSNVAPIPPFTTQERIIRRQRRTAHVVDRGLRQFLNSLQVYFQPGIGNPAARDPMVMLRVSRDGGHSWGNEIQLSAGGVGAYTKRMIARRLGVARDVVFEITVSDPAQWYLIDAYLDSDEGLN